MTTQQYAGPESTTGVVSGVRSKILGGTLVVSAVTIAVLLLTKPWGARNEFGYDNLAPVRDGMWNGVLVDGLGTAAIAIALGLVVCALARSRGAGWANVGAVVTALGGVLFAMGAFAFAALAWYATDTSVLAPADGQRLLEYAVDNPGHAMSIQMVGFLVYTLGTLALSVALLRAATVAKALPWSIIALTAVQFTPVPARLLDFVQIVLMVVLIGVAASYLRSSR